MSKGVRYDAAVAAAYVAWELVVSSPGAPEEAMLEKLTEIVLCAIEEAERRRAEVRRFACPRCLHRYEVNEAHQGKRCRCPKCGRTMLTPEPMGRN